jgi:hypothetical protein
VPWNSGDPLDHDHAQRWHAPPLLDRIDADPACISDGWPEFLLCDEQDNGIAFR